MESNLKTLNGGNIKSMSLLVGIHINSVLSKDDKLTKEVDNRIYPLVIPEGAPRYPFIVFGSSGISPTNTKDGSCEDNVSVSVVVIAKTYFSAIQIAQIVRYDLESVSGKYDEFEVTDCVLSGSSESYLQEIDAFSVELYFNIKTIDY